MEDEEADVIQSECDAVLLRDRFPMPSRGGRHAIELEESAKKVQKRPRGKH